MPPNYRRQVISQICARIDALLQEESDPVSTMRWIEGLLVDAEIARQLPTDDIFEFIINLEAVLDECNPDLFRFPNAELEEYENAEELILAII